MAILGQLKPGDSWENIEKCESNPVNVFLRPNLSRIDLDYGDITKSSEQKPGTRNLGVPRTKPILGICSCDRGRHVIKRDEKV
ncbi:hypothetical protein L2E82_30577 [Cichorium intybus]|uniref:Uncharacterized protein n=2 Tax=Cichorium intybus TaxID=13427 RepID=A0ACB9D0Y5_CICIN|nr:hypothetical protein L2E82_30576 [Cichorium intybus]KAI3740155.1 hypothetical protein L2E82_30577 [Cichorium intybus]